MPQAFSSPMAGIEAIIKCINPPPSAIVHFGSAGSGLTIPCCEGDGYVLRVETTNTRTVTGDPISLIKPGKCATLLQEYQVVYRTCFNTNTGKSAMAASKLTEMGTNVILNWWEALAKLWCCEPNNQIIKFAGVEDDPPDGGCGGWTMRLEAQIANCAPCVS